MCQDIAEYDGQVSAPTIQCSGAPDYIVTLSSETEGSNILYTLVDHGTIQDYPSAYTGPFRLTRSARLRAQAFRDGMLASEVTEQRIEVPLVMPYAGRPYELAPEPLRRGVIATNTGSGWLVNWRRLIGDASSTQFRLFRDGIHITADGFTVTARGTDNDVLAGFRVTLTDEAGREITVFTPADRAGTLAVTDVPEGEWSVTVTAGDRSGNESSYTFSWRYTAGTAEPGKTVDRF